MPSAFAERNVLSHGAVPGHERMRGNTQVADFTEVGMLVGSERIGKQLIDIAAAEASGRQADAMHDDELGHGAARTGIPVGRFDFAHAPYPATVRVDDHRNPIKLLK